MCALIDWLFAKKTPGAHLDQISQNFKKNTEKGLMKEQQRRKLKSEDKTNITVEAQSLRKRGEEGVNFVD